MNLPHCKYIDTAVGGPANRNHVMNIKSLVGTIPEDRMEVYATWHRFPEGYLTHFESSGTVTGYTGPSYADFLPCDFDGEDIEDVLQNVRNALRDLELKLDVENGVRVYFSGSKGFHVLLDAELFGGWVPSPSLADDLKNLSLKVMGDYSGFDPSIYDKNRLLRVPNTINAKSGLFKVPLSIDEVLTLDIGQIKELAKTQREMDYPAWGDCLESSGLQEIWNQVCYGTETITRKRVDVSGIWQRGLKEGDGRDNAAFAIARMLRKKGLDESNTLEILKLWDAQQTTPLGDKVLDQKVRSTYRMSRGPVEVNALMNPQELADAYHSHLEKLKQRKILLGFPAIDVRTRGIVPGEICTLIARSGVGKTAAAQNIIFNVATDNAQASSLFCSLEQPDSMCFERYAQMSTGRSGRSVEEDWINSDDARQNIRDSVVEKLGDKTLTYVHGVTLDSLNMLVDQCEVRTGKGLDLLVIDYLGYIGMEGMGRSLYEQVSNVARGLKQFAKARELCVVLLCQVGRMAGEDGKVPLTKSAARESGAIEESADIMIGMYRPHMGDLDLHGNTADVQIAMQILKNRKGSEGETYLFDFDRTSLRITGPGFLMRDEIPIKKTQRPQ